MSRRLLIVAVLLSTVGVSALPAGADSPAASAAAPITYELKFERPNTHLLDVTVRADSLSGPSVDFAIPDWAPGSYYIENYAANVQRFRAHSSEGRELSWRKTDSQTWRIELAGAKAVTVEYQVFANTLQNNIAQYNEHHAFIGGPSLWMYVVGGKERPGHAFDRRAGRMARGHGDEPYLCDYVSSGRTTIRSRIVRWRFPILRRRILKFWARSIT